MAEHSLFQDFNKTSSDEWRAKITEDLKGKAYETLVSSTPDGFRINPVYGPEDAPQNFSQPLAKNAFRIGMAINGADPAEANRIALKQLQRGAEALLIFNFDVQNLPQILKDIDTGLIRLSLRPKTEQIEEFVQSEKTFTYSAEFDPLCELAFSGNWAKGESQDLECLRRLHQDELCQGITVNTAPYANAGAPPAQQLGIAIASAYELLVKGELTDSSKMQIRLAVGSEYFSEIAKFRALRRLWAFLQQQLSLDEHALYSKAESAWRNKTTWDANSNLIRTSAEAMAAAIGMADEIELIPFNETYEEANDFSRRIAQNQIAILRHEAHLDKVEDISAGAYYLENLTEKLAGKGWEFFQSIEAQGGLTEALKNEFLQNAIAEQAQAEKQALDKGEKLLIGVNKYQPDNKGAVQPRRVDIPKKEKQIVKPLEIQRLSVETEQQKA